MNSGVVFMFITISLILLTLVVPLFVGYLADKLEMSERALKIWAKVLTALGLVGLFFASYKKLTEEEEPEPDLVSVLKEDAKASNNVFEKVSKETEAAQKEIEEIYEEVYNEKIPDDSPSPTIADILNEYKRGS